MPCHAMPCHPHRCSNHKQADALAAEGIEANSFLLLNVPDEMLIQRVVGRRLDPETGEIYHVDFSPPPADIVDRWACTFFNRLVRDGRAKITVGNTCT